MPNIKLTLEYDGSGFHGWQVQPNQRTIQEEVKKAIEIVLGHSIQGLTASGRTDAGVHALAQVANFHTEDAVDLDKLSYGISSILKNEVSVVATEIVSDDFHSRFNAKQKIYLYKILNRKTEPSLMKGRVWHITKELNLEILQANAQVLVGEHDFTSFRASGCSAESPVREIYNIQVEQEGELLKLRFTGNGFLKHMVRIITGTLIDLDCGRLDLGMQEILEAKDRELAGKTAPSEGLYLERVVY